MRNLDESDDNGDRLVDLAKRTYHGNTYVYAYYRRVREILGATLEANLNCGPASENFRDWMESVLNRIKNKLTIGDLGVEQ